MSILLAILLAGAIPGPQGIRGTHDPPSTGPRRLHTSLRVSFPVRGCRAVLCSEAPRRQFGHGAPRPAGCRPHRSQLRHGSARGRRIALTFDDGPSAFTPAILRRLEHLEARATFFVVGSHVAVRAAVVRRELRDGSEIGNHTWSHTVASPGQQLGETNLLIRRTTGFRPCLSRAPYGIRLRRFVAGSRRLGMSTVEWDVDPRDWALPGATTIVQRVLAAAHPGAIVVMHDGGGVRAQTVRALPGIIRGLRRRGYRLVTVSQLLDRGHVFQRGRAVALAAGARSAEPGL